MPDLEDFEDEEPITIYKVLLSRNLSSVQKYDWTEYLPKDGEPGEWFQNPSGLEPRLCVHGLHGWLTLEKAIYETPSGDRGALIYEMELKGDVQRDHEKATGRWARLTRVVADHRGESIVFPGELVWQ